MYYTLHQLQIFVKVAEKQSITKAAEELHLTQPAVSIQLKNLQNQFDIPLTEVAGRKLYITDFGEEIVQASRKILEEVDHIKHRTMAYKGHLVGSLKISVVSTAKYVMPYFLTDFLKQYPGIDLIMDVTNKAKVTESLEKNEVDFSMVSVLPENLKVNSVKLMQNKLFLVGGIDSKERNRMNLRTVEQLPLIYREKGSATRQAMERFIRRNGLDVKKSIELTSNEAVKQAMIAGLGYSITPLIGIKNELNNEDLNIIQLKGLPIITHWNLIWLKDKELSPIASAYLKFIQEKKEDIIQERFDWYEKY